MRIVLKLIAAAAIALFFPALASAANQTCLNVNFDQQAGALIAPGTTTSSTTATNIAGASINNITVANNSCFIVTYTGQIKAPKGARISLEVSGVASPPVAFPPFEDVSTVGTTSDTKTLVFIVRDAPTCSCTVQLKVQSLVNGQSVTAGRGLIRVESYAP